MMRTIVRRKAIDLKTEMGARKKKTIRRSACPQECVKKRIGVTSLKIIPNSAGKAEIS